MTRVDMLSSRVMGKLSRSVSDGRGKLVTATSTPNSASKRKTLCYSKCEEMLRASIKLLLHYLHFDAVPL